jgi:RND family efflux transporter MFP subunit
MPSVIIKGIITVAVVFFGVFIAAALVMTQPEPKQVEPEEIATTIRVLHVAKETLQLEVRSQGTVIPRQQSELIPEVSGRVKWVSPNLVAGGLFAKEEVLLRLDDRDYRSIVGRSEAAVSRAEAEDELARFEFSRMEELVKNKLTSQSSLESALRTQRITSATLVDAEIMLEQAERDLKRTEIRAPYDGLVRTEKVDAGQFLSRGQSIASIYASDSVEVRLPVADRQLAYLDLPLGFRGKIDTSDAPEVILSTQYAGQRYEWRGHLVRTEAEIDARSRMVTAVARVQSTAIPGQPLLQIGLFVNARIQGRLVNDIVSLPRAALRNQNQVLIVDADSRLRYRSVDVMRFEQDSVVISSGLETGEVVNVSPIQTVIDGMRVKPFDPQAAIILNTATATEIHQG